MDNLLSAWQEFLRSKKQKPDVQAFGFRLMDNLLDLHEALKGGTYQHGGYKAFKINDPKPRDIHKASVRDRLLHHAIYRVLYPYFDKKFISDSYSCRLGKGTHKAINRFRVFGGKAAQNYTRTCFVLKCDIRKFFANIDHSILKTILAKHISDPTTLKLLTNVIDSFHSRLSIPDAKSGYAGLPLGNLTSQLLVNIYMNEFDQFVKHDLKEKYYIRYADDFVFLSRNEKHLECLIPKLTLFLHDRLKIELHPNKLFIKTLSSGVDFLGWVHFLDHRVLRTATKRKMFRQLSEKNIQSYLGLLKHGNAYKLREEVKRVSSL